MTDDRKTLSTFESYEKSFPNKIDVVDGGHGAGRQHADMMDWCAQSCAGDWASCATPGDASNVHVRRWYFARRADADAFLDRFGGVPR